VVPVESTSLVLRGQVAIVTGGSRGIGLAIGRALAGAGASVMLTARSADELDAAALALGGANEGVAACAGDVADRAFCRRLLDETEATLGPPDILVNNAAIQGPIGLIEECAPEEWARTIEVDLLGPVWMMQAAVPGMKRCRRGAIINLSGGGATSPRERFTAYGAAKTALVRVTETVAEELRPFGIRCNAIAPGAVNTHLLDEVERAGDRAGAKAVAEAQRQRESGGTSPVLAAELAVFLASDAARQVTGRLISAVWDDWRGLRDGRLSLSDPTWFTLRRVMPSELLVQR